ncbi:MAG: hypothetical protein J6X61_04260 [Clostridia bacterium]|nr:hypothetical protein [Clostridia bacterium]
MFDNKILRAVALMLASVLLLAAAACAPDGETASSEAASRGGAASQDVTSEAASQDVTSETASQGEAASSQTETVSSQDATSSQEEDMTARIRGTLANGVYTNAWAGFRFTLPAGTTPVDAEQMAMYENGSVLYGVMAAGGADTTRMITVMFEDASASDAAVEERLSAIAGQIAAFGGNYDLTVSDPFKTTIAGQEYAVVRFELSGGTDDGASLGIRLNGGKVVQYYCMREKDDVYISVIVADPNENWIKSTLGSFAAV